MSDTPKTGTVGWREWVHLPEFDGLYIKAKVDTGAKTSALHAFFVEPFERNGEAWVRFGLHPQQGCQSTEAVCEARALEQREVTDSGGHKETRYVITTAFAVGGRIINTEATLTNRDSMRFRMLLGRNTLKGHFTVDPQRSFLCGGDKHHPPQRC
jgi:hypothetical protein